MKDIFHKDTEFFYLCQLSLLSTAKNLTFTQNISSYRRGRMDLRPLL